jgi:hypothetical protein
MTLNSMGHGKTTYFFLFNQVSPTDFMPKISRLIILIFLIVYLFGTSYLLIFNEKKVASIILICDRFYFRSIQKFIFMNMVYRKKTDKFFAYCFLSGKKHNPGYSAGDNSRSWKELRVVSHLLRNIENMLDILLILNVCHQHLQFFVYELRKNQKMDYIFFYFEFPKICIIFTM